MPKSDGCSPLDGFGTALRTLTILRWPGARSEDFGSSLLWFPIVGMLLGLVLYGTALVPGLLPFPPWHTGTALIVLLMDICLTRGLHLDGLADWADSIGGYFQRDRRLSIMKDTSLGAFGVLALVSVLLVRLFSFERLISSVSLFWLPVIYTLSRGMMVELMTTLPYARAERGMGHPFVARASARNRVLCHGITAALCIPFGPIAFLLFLTGWLEARLFGIRCRQQFGGITGDLLGTANVMVETTLLMVCAFTGSGLNTYLGWGWLLQ